MNLILTPSADADDSIPSAVAGTDDPQSTVEEQSGDDSPSELMLTWDENSQAYAAENGDYYLAAAESRSVWDSWNKSSHRFTDVLGRLWSNDELFPAYTAWEFKPGNDRVLGDGQIMMPLWQSCDALIFADLRGQLDDSENYEGNWGIGIRQIRDDGWIAGAYGFYDLRRTENDHNFNQATFGLEALSVEWEARVNGYIPESGGKRVNNLNLAQIRGGTIVVRAGEERAYYGVDAEIGRLLKEWRCGDVELRGFVGGYHFDTSANGFPNVSGPRGRVELRLYDLDILGEGSRLTLGGELQWDEVRDTQAFAMLRVRIPLGRANTARTLSRLERRMLDRVVRDVDIVSQAQAGRPEAAINPLTGRTFGQVTVVNADGDLQTAVNSSGLNGTVIANGAAGQLDQTATVNLLAGQTLLGGGSALQVTGVRTGAAATFTAPGSKPVINQADTTMDVINLADNTAVFGNTIQGGRDGLVANGVQGSIVIQNNMIQNTDRDGILIDLSGNEMLAAHIENNRFVNIDDTAIQANVSDNAVLDLSQSIVGNTFLGMNNTDFGIRLEVDANDGGTAMITASIRDNVFSDLNQDGVFLDVDDSGILTTTITNNDFLRIAGDGVEVSVGDIDDSNITQTTTIANNRFTDIAGAGVRIGSNDNDSDGEYLVNQITTITGNTFLRNGTGVAIQYDAGSEADDGQYVSRTTISGNTFMNGLGDGINLDVSDWDDEGLTIVLDITGNNFMTHAGNAINLDVGDIDLDSGVVNFLPTITGNTFTGTALDNILIDVSDQASLIGVITGNMIFGGVDGLDITSGGDGPNSVVIGGNSINNVTGTAILFDSAAATNILDFGMDNTVFNPGTTFTFNNVGNLGGSQILINGTRRPPRNPPP